MDGFRFGRPRRRGRWAPPDPSSEYTHEDNVARLRAFQRMTEDQQRRVIHFHLQRSHTPAEAIDAVLTEVRRNLLRLPIPMREEYTAGVRSDFTHISDIIYRQWHFFEAMIQNLPERHREAGRRVYRILTNDPLDPKCLMDTRRLAGSTIGLGFVNRLLDEMVRNAFIYRNRHDELRSLRLYDRHQTPNPPALEVNDEVLKRLKIVMANQTVVDMLIPRIYRNMTALKSSMRSWLLSIVVQNRSHPGVQDVYESILLSRTGNWKIASVFSNLVELAGGKKALKNLDNPLQIMCMVFYGSCFGVDDRIDWVLLDQLADIQAMAKHLEDRTIRTMRDGVSAVRDSHISCRRRITILMLQDFRELLDKHPEISQLINAFAHSPEDFCRAVTTENWSMLPLTTQALINSYQMMDEASEHLFAIDDDISNLRNPLRICSSLLPPIRDDDPKLRPNCPVINMGTRRGKLIAARASALPRLQQLNRDFEALVDLCPHPRARAEILSLLAAPGPTDYERIRDLAAVAAVPTISTSAQRLASVALSLTACTAHIAHVEHAHYHRRIAAFTPAQLASTLRTRLASPPSHTPTPTPAIGPALRALPTDTHIPPAILSLTTASLHHPTSTIVRLLLSSPPPPPASFFAPVDILLLARLLVRAWYLAEEAPPASPADCLRLLSRHCWQLGLHDAWLAWYVRARALLAPAEGWFAERGVNVIGALGDPARRAGLLEEVREAVRDGMGDVVRHLRRLDRLRMVTVRFLGARDAVDLRVLPEDFCGVDGGVEMAGEEVQAYDVMHRFVRFEGCVLDGGRLVVRDEPLPPPGLA